MGTTLSAKSVLREGMEKNMGSSPMNAVENAQWVGMELLRVMRFSSREFSAVPDLFFTFAAPGLKTSYCSHDCPVGRYLPKTGSEDLRDCVYCPKGRYGQTVALTTSLCTAQCPVGRYRDLVGGVTKHDCTYCPSGMPISISKFYLKGEMLSYEIIKSNLLLSLSLSL
jgi:hypothetical protein